MSPFKIGQSQAKGVSLKLVIGLMVPDSLGFQQRREFAMPENEADREN